MGPPSEDSSTVRTRSLQQWVTLFQLDYCELFGNLSRELFLVSTLRQLSTPLDSSRGFIAASYYDLTRAQGLTLPDTALPCLSLCRAQPVFKVIPLGVEGGNDESNLSAYALAVSRTEAYVCLDAGTLYHGIERAVAAQVFSGTVFEVLRDKIKGYLISHPHLDHIAGLILNSPDDSPKPIYGLPFCLEAIQETYFNWKSWPNFGDRERSPSSRNTAIRHYPCRKRHLWRGHRWSFEHSR